MGLVFMLYGCSHSSPFGRVPVSVTPKLVEKVYEERIPLNVGLYITDEFKNYQFPLSGKTFGLTYDFYNLGSESAGVFEFGLGQMFDKVLLVDEKPPFSKPKTVIPGVVIEPKIDKFALEMPTLAFQTWISRIQYSITVYDPSGKAIWTKNVEGLGDTKGDYRQLLSPPETKEEITQNPSRSATKAVEDGTSKALEAIYSSQEIRGLLPKEKKQN